MKKLVRRNALISLQTIFGRLEDFFDGNISVDLAYFAMKNLESIEAELKLINENEVLKYPEEHAEFENKRLEILGQFAEKDADGNFALLEGSSDAQISAENRGEFDKAIASLREEYASVIEQITEINAKKEEFMAGESEIEMYTFSRKLLPSIKTEGKGAGWALTVMSMLSVVLSDED
jgi:hypothetical protein